MKTGAEGIAKIKYIEALIDWTETHDTVSRLPTPMGWLQVAECARLFVEAEDHLKQFIPDQDVDRWVVGYTGRLIQALVSLDLIKVSDLTADK